MKRNRKASKREAGTGQSGVGKGTNGSRSQLRAMQRHNRKTSGYTTLDGKVIRPRDERIKRNHMQTVNLEARMHTAMMVRSYIPDHVKASFVPLSDYT